MSANLADREPGASRRRPATAGRREEALRLLVLSPGGDEPRHGCGSEDITAQIVVLNHLGESLSHQFLVDGDLLGLEMGDIEHDVL